MIRPELDTPAATCMKMGPTNSDKAAKHGLHTLNMEGIQKGRKMLQATREGRRTSQDIPT